MADNFKVAALGALGGAAISLAVVFGVAVSGKFPANEDRRIHDYLLSHPEILNDMSEKLQAEADDQGDHARQVAIDKAGLSAFFDPKVAFIAGPKSAKATFVEFFDYNCPYCRASVPAVQKFYNAHRNDVRFAFIEFPIKGAQSTFAARAAMAARKQPDKYLPFHFALMTEDGPVDANLVIADAKKVGIDVTKLEADMQAPDIAAAIAASLGLAHRVHVDGTPEFIVNGKSREGAVDDDLLTQMSKG
jgi:protein-disulfide isomerase